MRLGNAWLDHLRDIVSCRKNLLRERGVILPLTAIIMSTVFFIMVALGVDTTRTKEAQAFASYLADEVCGFAVDEMPMSRLAVDKTIGLIRTKDVDTATTEIDINSYTTIERVTYMVPSLPTDIDGDPYLAGAAKEISHIDLDHTTCSDTAAEVCFLAGDLGESDITDKYPAIWSDEMFGSFIGCRVELRVNTLMSGDRIAQASAIYRKFVGGEALQDPPAGVGAPFNSRSVTIGFANQLAIRDPDGIGGGGDDRFEFPLDVGYNNQRLWDSDDLGTSDVFSLFRAKHEDTFLGVAYPQRTSNLAITEANEGLADRDAAWLRCYNPLSAVRNVMAHYITRVLARMYETRDNVTYALVNPINDANNDGVRDNSNGPTIMIPRGRDLLPDVIVDEDDGFALPLINYMPPTTGPNSKVVNGQGLSPDGYLCPFNPINGSKCSKHLLNATTRALRRHHNLVASQMQDCFYITNENSGVVALKAETLVNEKHEEGGIGFQPWQHSAADYVTDVGKNHWGYTEDEHIQNAEELMLHMSTISHCPFEWTAGVPQANAHSPSCSHPVPVDDHTLTPSGMRGDVVAFLEYTNGDTDGWSMPGRFDVTGQAADNIIVNPEVGEVYATTGHSHVILFMHKRLDPVNDIGDIQDQVDDLNAAGRRVTVIYIPAYAEDASDDVDDQLKDAFRATDDSSMNRVYNIRPTAFGSPACNEASEYPDCFNDFWIEELLTAAVDNIEDRAKTVLNRIFETAPVL